MNKRDLLPLLVTMALTAVLVLAAIDAPVMAAIAFGAIIATGLLTLVRGWWRRAYVVAILSMFAGASNIDALAAVGGPLKIAALGALTVVTFAVTAGKPAQYHGGVHKAAMGILWLTVGFALVSVIWSVSRRDTLTEGLTLAAFVFILHRVSTVRWQNRDVMAGDIAAGYWASFVALAAGQALATAGMFEAVSGFSGRQQGILNNPNLLGMLAAITFAVGIGVAAQKRSVITWVSLLLPAAQIVLSQSRTALIAAAVAVAFIIVKGSVGRLVAAGAIVLLVVLLMQVYGIDLGGDSLDRFTANEGGDVLNARGDAWDHVILHLQGDPLGVGWAAAPVALKSLYALGAGVGLTSVHNSYLQMLYELGWGGALPVVLVAGLLLVVAIKTPAKGLGAGLAATVVAGISVQLTESAMFGVGQPYPYLFWFAVLAATMSIESKPAKERTRKGGKFYTLEPGTSKVRAVR